MSCLDDNAMQALAEGRLSQDEWTAAHQHLDTCPSCRVMVGELGRMKTLLPAGAVARAATPTVTPDSLATGHLPRGASVGRYLILNRIGAGGFGVVYAAYDPQLDRKVAVKLRKTGTLGERLVKEARAMARLNHPNVVAVHDVGIIDDEFFVAMDLIDGGDLRGWLKAHGSSAPSERHAEVLRIFGEAARGLGAAHAAGMVHRDFKPENVLIAADGRVFVTDFGLTRLLTASEPTSELMTPSPALRKVTSSSMLAGTPRYMAPEQFSGTSDARSDQYAFCVALHEALLGTVPPPAGFEPNDTLVAPGMLSPHVAAALVKGLQTHASERFASMELLREALLPPQRRDVRRYVAAAVGLAAVAAVSGVMLVSSRAAARNQCRQAGATLDAVWAGPQRDAIAQAFAKVPKPFAAAAQHRVTTELDQYAVQWKAHAEQACVEFSVEHSHTPVVYQAQQLCLERARMQMLAVSRVFERADEEVVKNGFNIQQMLPSLDACNAEGAARAQGLRPLDQRVAGKVEALYQEANELSALLVTSRREEGLPRALKAQEQARALDFLPLDAELALVVGDFQYWKGQYSDALKSFEAAAVTAEQLAMDVLRLKAMARQVRCLRDLGRLEDAASLGRQAHALEQRLPLDVSVSGALAANVSVVMVDLRLPREAAEEARRGLELAQKFSPQFLSVEAHLHNAMGNAAAVANNFSEAEKEYRLAHSTMSQATDPSYPGAVSYLINVGWALCRQGKFAEGLQATLDALDLAVKNFGATNPKVAVFVLALSWAHLTVGQPKEALADVDGVLGTLAEKLGKEHWRYGEALTLRGRALRALGRSAEAVLDLTQAEQVLERAMGKLATDTADASARLAEALLDTGKTEAAVAAAQRTLAVNAQTAHDPDVDIAAHAVLAQALWANKAHRTEATQHAEEAAALIAKEPPEFARTLPDMRAWLAAHPSAP